MGFSLLYKFDTPSPLESPDSSRCPDVPRLRDGTGRKGEAKIIGKRKSNMDTKFIISLISY